MNKDEVWLQTYPSGRIFHPFNPQPHEICLEDIARALSFLCHWTGQVSHFFSIAQHSVIVSQSVAPELALQGLLHDAAEAYCADIPSPLKEWLPEYRKLENGIWCAIADRFNVPREIHPDVHRADQACLLAEHRDLRKPGPNPLKEEIEPLPQVIAPLGFKQSEDLFMDRFSELTQLDQ